MTLKRKLVVLFLIAQMFAMNQAIAISTLGGSFTCSDWLRRSEHAQRGALYEVWLVGYLTGIALQSKVDFLRNIQASSVDLWMDNFCRTHPLDTPAIGGYRLAKELAARNGLILK